MESDFHFVKPPLRNSKWQHGARSDCECRQSKELSLSLRRLRYLRTGDFMRFPQSHYDTELKPSSLFQCRGPPWQEAWLSLLSITTGCFQVFEITINNSDDFLRLGVRFPNVSLAVSWQSRLSHSGALMAWTKTWQQLHNVAMGHPPQPAPAPMLPQEQ